MFKLIPLTQRAKSGKGLVYGVGINDADYQVKPKINGKRYYCPFYERWCGMIRRCYDSKSLSKKPSYMGCSVCESWLLFSNFKGWMIKQDWKGKQLDKDLVITGNKVYSPEACLFVTGEINKLLTDSGATRGIYPLGVSALGVKFQASCNNGKGKIDYLGLFSTQEQASKAYLEYKEKLLINISINQEQPLKGYLVRISQEYSKKASLI